MTTLSYAPAYPIPGRELSAVFALTESGANFVRVWCTVAPDGSELDSKIKAAASSSARAMVFESEAGDGHPWKHTFDKGGVYTLVAQEYQKGTGFTGGYQGDTRANQEEAVLGTETTLYVYVGKRMTCTVGTGADTATLALWVWQDRIRPTTVALHGEVTPAIQKPTSARATTAAKTAAVTTALAALANVAVSTAVGTVSAVVSDFATVFNGHIPNVTSSMHAHADTDNLIGTVYSGAPAPDSLVAFSNEALRRVRQHLTNDYGGNAGGVTGIGSANGTSTAPDNYHGSGGNAVTDLVDLPLMRSVSTAEDAYRALADIWRVHEAHRVNVAVHALADTNALAALPALLNVHRRFFESLAAAAPVAAPGDTTGSALLKSIGFKEN